MTFLERFRGKQNRRDLWFHSRLFASHVNVPRSSFSISNSKGQVTVMWASKLESAIDNVQKKAIQILEQEGGATDMGTEMELFRRGSKLYFPWTEQLRTGLMRSPRKKTHALIICRLHDSF